MSYIKMRVVYEDMVADNRIALCSGRVKCNQVGNVV